MADLEELAGRVEGLSGPDRETDCRIYVALSNILFEAAHVVVPDNSQWVAPPYTASIDAAIALIDETAWRLSLSETVIEDLPRWEVALIRRDAGFGRGRKITVTGHTLPTTITAAALRARTQGNQNG